MSKLSNLVYSNSRYSDLVDSKEKQRVLDEITPEILESLSTQEICDHTNEVYNATVDEYADEKHNIDVIDELIEFMDILPDNCRVLDIGCGVGRDSLFMAYGDNHFRERQMQRDTKGKTTIEKFPVPTKVFKPIGLDSSVAMIEHARKKARELLGGRFYPQFVQMDMHDIDRAYFSENFDGILCCTSLLTHTPKELVEPSLASLSQLLKTDGTLLLTYINRLSNNPYDKLKLSQTGHIKYFSQPDPDDIVAVAEAFGLKLTKQTMNDFEVDGVVKVKNLFVAQFYRKL